MMKTSFVLFLVLMIFLAGCGKDLVVIETNMGNIIIELDKENAPNHAANFKKLVKEQFYVGTTFHRIIPGVLIQGGDPNSKDMNRSNDGLGDPGYKIEAEIKLPHVKGAVAAARQGDQINPEKKSNGSQFYICLDNLSQLDGNYTVFGKVISGLEVAQKISRTKADRMQNPLRRIVMEKVYMK